jgi:hypothetical protein
MDAPSQSSDDVVVAQFEKNKKEEVRISKGTKTWPGQFCRSENT